MGSGQTPLQAKVVFVKMPQKMIQSLHDQGWHF
jgi:hypothetical protein